MVVCGSQFVAKVNKNVLYPGQKKNGAFITGCHEHCGQWAQGQIAGPNSDFNATIDSTTAPFAVQAWYEANKAGKQRSAGKYTSNSRRSFGYLIPGPEMRDVHV